MIIICSAVMVISILCKCSPPVNRFIVSEINHNIEYVQPFNGKLWEYKRYRKLKYAVGHTNKKLGIITNTYIAERRLVVNKIHSNDTIIEYGVDTVEITAMKKVLGNKYKFVVDTIYVMIK